MPRCDYFENDQTWACMTTDLNDGGVYVVGCEVSCWPCDDVSALLINIGVDSYGDRWLRPASGGESRDATGARRPIRSDIPVLLPRGNTYFELAPCWEQLADGSVLEWWRTTICDCNDKCPDPPGACVFLVGIVHTCFAFTGHRWPPDEFVCTGKYVGHIPIVISMTTNALGQAAFARTSNATVLVPNPDTWCTSNLGVFCWGHTEASGTCEQPAGWPDYYNGDNEYNLWNYAHVTSFSARFAEDTAAPDDFRAAIVARNAAMQFIADDIAKGDDAELNVNQIESPRRHASPAQNFNSVLDYWGNVWNPYGLGIPFADLPVVMEFPNSKLVNTGHPVIAEYILMGVAIEMSMVLHRIKSTPPCSGGGRPLEERLAIYPMIRMKVTAWMGMRVRFPDGAPRYLERTWRDPPDQVSLIIENGYDQTFPRILGNYDRVVYIDDQLRTLAPPPRIMWQGHRGFFSDPPTEDRFHYVAYEAGAGECIAAAVGLEGMLIPAMESHPDNDEGDRKRIWTGSMKCAFPWRDY